MTRYAHMYAAKYAVTFSNPTLARRAQCRDDVEWISRPRFDYGPKFWKLIAAYATNRWTDDRGCEHCIIDKNRMTELGEAYAEFAVEQKEATK